MAHPILYNIFMKSCTILYCQKTEKFSYDILDILSDIFIYFCLSVIWMGNEFFLQDILQ
jgi:hypothetical protein